MLKGLALRAVPVAVCRLMGAVAVPAGTRPVSAVGLAESHELIPAELPKVAVSLAELASNDVPTMVTIVPGTPAGGETKLMRGPSRRAMRMPLKVPDALLLLCDQLPLAVSSGVLSAVSCQAFTWQGVRLSVPLNSVPFDEPDSDPSMQSTSPVSVPKPDTLDAVCATSPSQKPVTVPSSGSVPCQLPAQMPARSGGVRCGVDGESPPPPQLGSKAMPASRMSAQARWLFTGRPAFRVQKQTLIILSRVIILSRLRSDGNTDQP